MAAGYTDVDAAVAMYTEAIDLVLGNSSEPNPQWYWFPENAIALHQYLLGLRNRLREGPGAVTCSGWSGDVAAQVGNLASDRIASISPISIGEFKKRRQVLAPD